MSPYGVRCFVGLDLAQASAFTALAVLERPRVPPRASPAQRRPAYALRHLRRFPLGTPYPEVIREVRGLLQTPAVEGALLMVDQTGVGKAVVRLLDDGLRHQVTCLCWPVMLSAGHARTTDEGGGTLLPKKELVGTLQVLLQTRRLHIGTSLPDAALLVKELENFKAKVTLARDDAVAAWREGQHDDLVLAVALAAWGGEQALPPLVDPPEEPAVTRLIVV